MRLPRREPDDLRRRLERERPAPEGDFALRARASLAERWTAISRPAGLWIWSAALVLVGLALMVAALVIALR